MTQDELEGKVDEVALEVTETLPNEEDRPKYHRRTTNRGEEE